jgi:sugar-specific transcriptional regulator TrmB
MKIAQRVLELVEILVVFQKIRNNLLDELENTTNEMWAITTGKYINDLTTLINSVKSILEDAERCINITQKEYKRYQYNDRVENIIQKHNKDGIKIFEELAVLYQEHYEKLDTHFQRTFGCKFASKKVRLDGTLHNL